MKLPALEKAKAAARSQASSKIKKELPEEKTKPLGEMPVTIVDSHNTEEEHKISDDSPQGINPDKEVTVEIETLSFRPANMGRQTARRGKKFRPATSERLTNLPISEYNEIEAAKSLVGLADAQPKSGYIHKLHSSENEDDENKESDIKPEEKRCKLPDKGSKKIKDDMKNVKKTKVKGKKAIVKDTKKVNDIQNTQKKRDTMRSEVEELIKQGEGRGRKKWRKEYKI